MHPDTTWGTSSTLSSWCFVLKATDFHFWQKHIDDPPKLRGGPERAYPATTCRRYSPRPPQRRDAAVVRTTPHMPHNPFSAKSVFVCVPVRPLPAPWPSALMQSILPRPWVLPQTILPRPPLRPLPARCCVTRISGRGRTCANVVACTPDFESLFDTCTTALMSGLFQALDFPPPPAAPQQPPAAAPPPTTAPPLRAQGLGLALDAWLTLCG